METLVSVGIMATAGALYWYSKQPDVSPNQAGLFRRIALGLFFGWFVYVVFSCGPIALCYAEGGEPVTNAFGVEWCEIDGDGFLTERDALLSW